MGALHRGHVSLVKRAVKDCGFIVASIFINPSQFSPGEDYKKYPRQLEKDIKILSDENVDLLFTPSPEDMYPENFETWIEIKALSGKLEGKFRPGHFKGVCTVVAKLFNIVQPERAYFGWKDAQQLVIIKRMTNDLGFPIQVIGMPTIREEDGLAASSRNACLSKDGRKKSLCLYHSLRKMSEMVEYFNIRDVKTLLKEGKKIIADEEVILDYLEAVDLYNLEPVAAISKNTGILGAIRVKNVRLIDNIIWEI
jgi:pantoate--beta-alanine ligase